MDSKSVQALLAAELPAHKLRVLERELGAFPSAEAIAKWSGLAPKERRRVQEAITCDLDGVLSKGVEILLPKDYPERLQHLESMPPALFAWGNKDVLWQPTVAIVGTRGASTYGKAVAQKFGERLAAAGVTVVSGGAIGIDAAAHEGALSVAGNTAVVFGSGIDKTYPMMHRGLYDQVKKSGCLISQFAAGTNPSGYRFVMRNTLIAALADAVLVIEAPEKSGSLITAVAAAEMNKTVFVVPANIDRTAFRGSHDLIRQGANLVDHPDQILEDLKIAPVAEAATAPAPVTDVQKTILAVLSVEPTPAEKIADSTGMDPSQVMSELTMLELEGRILRDAGGYALKP